MSVSTHAAIAHFARHRGFLVAFAKQLGASHADAQDCAQVTLTKAWQHIDDFEGADYENSLRAWLSTILRNTYFSLCRRGRVANKHSHIFASDAVCQCVAEDACEVERLISAIDRLSESQRTVISAYLLGSDYEQIAAQLALPVGTVKSRMNRAREALSKQGIQ